MKKDIETRFMPNVKFLLPKSAEFGFWINFLAITKLHSIDNYIGFCTNAFGDSIYNGFEHIELFNNYKSVHKEVSIYEAIPELIPDGMRYNKELDKLVPDVIEEDNSAFRELAERFKNHTIHDTFKFIEEMDKNKELKNKTPDIALVDGFASGGFVSNNILEPAGAVHSSEDFYTEEEGNVVLKHLFSKDEKINTRENGFIKADLYKALQDILDSNMNYGDKIRAIRNAASEPKQNKKHTGGDGNKWYDLPKNANQLQDLIEHKNMNGNIKDCFKACYRIGEKEGTEDIYDVEKMAYYSLRELGRLKGTKDYVALVEKLMGKQNIKGEK